MESRKFQIQNIGMVKGGTFEYDYDAKAEVLNYKANVVTTLFGNERNNDSEGTQAIASSQLKASNYNRPGAPVHFAGLVGQVVHVANGIATANLRVEGLNAEGVGTFEVTGEYVNLISLNAKIKFSFFITAQIVALPLTAGSGIGLMNSKSKTKV